jgi:tRNA1(Val) A37 N6-methylase TrmN6
VTDTTADRFLDGRVVVRQPTAGFRGGLDAVMVAAAVPAMPGDEVLELGAGCGTASLCLAARIGDCAITGVEIEPSLVALANANAAANDLAQRVRFVEADIFAMPTTVKREFAHVFANPPFHHAHGQRSENSLRASAKHGRDGLGGWLDEGLKRVTANGTFSLIVRADRLGEVTAGGCGSGVVIFPLWPRRAEAARRVIVQFRKGSAAPTILLPGLVLHEPDGRYTIEADAVLRGRAALELALQDGSRR